MSNDEFAAAMCNELYPLLLRYVPAENRVPLAAALGALFSKAVIHGSEIGATAADQVYGAAIDRGLLVDATQVN